MTNNNRWTIGRILTVAAMVVVIIAGAAGAENYISWRGGFHITIPERFEQMDFGMIDGYLRANRADREVLDYEVVFGDTSNLPFPECEYFLVTLEKLTEPSESQIDSMLSLIFGSFGRRMRYAPVTDFVTNLSSNTPSYSRDNRIASVINDVTQPDGSSKRNLMMIKFYDEGIVSFFYYAPDSVFVDGVEQMRQIVQSLSTADLDSLKTGEKPKITSARPSEKPDRKNDEDSGIPIAIYVGIGVVLIVVIARRRKKTKK